MKPQILGSIRMNGRSYKQGDEAALQAIITSAQCTDFINRGLIEGEWEGVNSVANEVALQYAAGTQSNITIDDMFEFVASGISGELAIARSSEEGAREFIFRLVGERVGLQTRLEQQEQQFDKSYGELSQKYDELKAEYDKLTEDLDASPEQRELVASLEPLGQDVITELLYAGYNTPDKVRAATSKELEALPKIGKAKAAQIQELFKPKAE